MPENNKEITLRVAELPSSQQSDIGIGIARMDLRRMAELGVREGEVIEIEGSRKTGAIAYRPYPSDSGLDIIRMDPYLRKNAGTSAGEKVTVKKGEYKEAKKAVICPAENVSLVPVPQLNDRVKLRLIGRVLTRGDIISLVTRKMQLPGSTAEVAVDIPLPFETKFVIANTEPKGGIVKITEITEIEVLSKAVEVKDEAEVPSTSYEDVGGLKEELKKVREMIEHPLKHPEIFERVGVSPPKGILLYGPPGTGKTLLARAIASECGVNFISLVGSELVEKFLGDTEKKIRDLFDQAAEKAPTIIFVDEIDAIAPKRGEVNNYDRFVTQLLACMDGMEDRGQVVVIAATNQISAIDPALRRPGRFDREIEIGVPNKDGRKEILQIHTRNMPLAKNVDVEKIANITHGYVGADLSALVREAAMAALRKKVFPKIDASQKEIDMKVLDALDVDMADFEDALKIVEPSAMREVSIDIPNVSWNDVGGLDKIKQYLNEMVEWPLKHPEAFTKMGITPPKGILLYGLPGTGKTLIAKAVAHEGGLNFISVKGPELHSKWVNESEKHIRDLFKRAKQVAPVIIFFDEIDALAPRRDAHGNEMFNKPVAQLLTELDGLEGLKGVIVIGATNRPDMLDPALLRPGRFDRHVEVPLPDKASRKKIFEVHLKGVPIDKSVKTDALVAKTDGFVGADIEALCREAAIVALREDINAKAVTEKHFKEALSVMKPSTTKEDAEKFKKRVEKTSKIKAPEDIAYLG
ncbi:MAG: CDC48 family AAA ATPase [Nanoarchaeota archaeon]|nr:CDC48 family AAA ATPase [Nanoarchaeota archaeon]MBU4300513.1 CDC48 family AAA ATPase [Nanoarchaeota archaeon]MBU4451992.1 CDC48 family AAA ATPase [Nanoarchaeota archaeon]MCG2724153.1 CDC48 family AAA ATPase [archaeon]